MYCYNGTCTNTKGDSLVGYFVECLLGTTVQAIYSDNVSTPILGASGVANRAKTDDRGNFFFFVADGTYSLKYYDTAGVFQFSQSNFTMVGTDSTIAAATSAAASATSASAAAASAAAATAASAKSANTLALITAATNYPSHPEELVRTTAAAPNDIPAVAVGAVTVASTINARAATSPLVTIGANPTKIKWLSGLSIFNSGAGTWLSRGAFYSPGRTNQYGAFEFNHTGTVFDISVIGGFNSPTNNMRIIVNDREAAVCSVPASGDFHYVKYTFPTSATRRIRIEGDAGQFAGVNCVSASEITGTGRTYPVVTLMGDSFPEGTGADRGYSGEGVIALRALGVNPAVAAVGGTGLLLPGAYTNWQNVTRMVDLTLAGTTDAITAAAMPPAMGVVCLSVNDQGLNSTYWAGAASYKQAIKNALWKLVDAWQTANSGKPLVLVGPTWTNGTPIMSLFEMRDAAKEVAAGQRRNNVHFIDRFGPFSLLRGGTNDRLTTTGTATNASTIITGIPSTAAIGFQAAVYINGIRCGSVQSVDSATQVTLTKAAATADGTTGAGAPVIFLSSNTGLYTSVDGTHPSQDGHTLDGLALTEELRKIIMFELA